MKTIKTLQIGRAIAAISVAMIHLSMMMGTPRYGGVAVFREYTSMGDLGVDFFFVLSGFIILYAHVNDIDEPKAWKKYIYRRFVRLFPIYWLYTLVFTIVFMIIGGVVSKIPNNIIDWLTSLTLIRFSSVKPPLSVAWTLFHELAFYIIFSLMILNQKIGIVALIAFACSAILFFHFPHEDFRSAFDTYTSAYNLHFIFGMGAFWLYQKGGKGILELAMGISLISLAIIFSMQESEPAFFKLLSALGMAFLLAGLTKLEVEKNLQFPTFLAFIGDASYTIYMTHSNFEGTLLKVERFFNLRGIIGEHLVYLFVLIGAVLMGCAAYWLIEKPLLDSLRKQ